jgi:WD40 repeat protein
MNQQCPHAPHPGSRPGDAADAPLPRCPACGEPNARDDRFCGACGAPRPAPAAPEPPSSARPPEAEESGPPESPAASEPPQPPRGRHWLRRLLILLLLAALGAGGYLGLWLLADELKPGYVYSLAFSADGSRLASAGPDEFLRLWETGNGQPLASVELPYGLHAIALAPDASRLAVTGSAGTIRLFSLPGLAPLGELAGHRDTVQALCFDADGTTLYSVDSHFGFGVWDANRRTRLGGLDPREEAIAQHAAFSADCTLLALGSGIPDYEIQVVRRINLEPVMRIAPDYGERPEQFTLALKGSLLFGVRYGHITLWRVSSGKVTRSLDFEEIYPTALAVSPNNRYFAVGSGDGEVHLYDGGKGTPLRTLRHADALAQFLQEIFPTE